MAAEKLNLKNAKLEKGEKVVVRGILGYTKYLTRPLEGKELEASVARREYATDVPHYEGTIRNPKIVLKTKGQPTDAEKVIAGKIYTSTDKESGEEFPVLSIEKKLSKEGKGQILFGVKRADGIHKVDVQGKSLLQGQEVEVTYVTREYDYKGKKGLSLFLDTIVFESEPEFFKPQAREGWVSDDEDSASTTEAEESAESEDAAPTEDAGGVWE